MRTILLLIVLSVCFVACTSTTRLTNRAINYTLVTQKENIVQARLGLPARTVPLADGGKVLIYEYYGYMFDGQRDKRSKSYRVDEYGVSHGFEIDDVFNTLAYDSHDANFEKYTNYLEVYLDSDGYCVDFRHDLNKEQMKFLYNQFKRYAPGKP